MGTTDTEERSGCGCFLLLLGLVIVLAFTPPVRKVASLILSPAHVRKEAIEYVQKITLDKAENIGIACLRRGGPDSPYIPCTVEYQIDGVRKQEYLYCAPSLTFNRGCKARIHISPKVEEA